MPALPHALDRGERAHTGVHGREQLHRGVDVLDDAPRGVLGGGVVDAAHAGFTGAELLEERPQHAGALLACGAGDDDLGVRAGVLQREDTGEQRGSVLGVDLLRLVDPRHVRGLASVRLRLGPHDLEARAVVEVDAGLRVAAEHAEAAAVRGRLVERHGVETEQRFGACLCCGLALHAAEPRRDALVIGRRDPVESVACPLVERGDTGHAGLRGERHLVARAGRAAAEAPAEDRGRLGAAARNLDDSARVRAVEHVGDEQLMRLQRLERGVLRTDGGDGLGVVEIDEDVAHHRCAGEELGAEFVAVVESSAPRRLERARSHLLPHLGRKTCAAR